MLLFMKHTLIIAGLALLSFSSCKNSTGGDTAGKADDAISKAEKNKKVVMAFMENVNAHNVSAVYASVSPDFVEYQDGSSTPQKIDEIKKTTDEFFKSFPDIKGDNQLYYADGNTVLVKSDWSMTFKNYLGTIKATGKTAKFTDIDMFTLNDSGIINTHRSIYPGGTIMKLVGVDLSKTQSADKPKEETKK